MKTITHFEQFFFDPQETKTTDTEIDLTNLESNALYRIIVLSRNEHGTSLPSSILLINTTEKGAEQNDHCLRFWRFFFNVNR